MRITEIAGKNFKGQATTRQKLAPLNVITGNNAAGKSRLLEMVRAGLIGYDPALGKGKTRKLFSGAASVQLTLDDGQQIARDFKATDKPGLDIPGVMLDFKTFLDKTGPAQLAYVISQTDMAGLGFTREQITADLRAIVPEKPTEATELAFKEVLAEITAADDAAAKFVEDGKPVNLNQWLEVLAGRLGERLKLSRAELKRLTGTIQTGVALNAENPAAVTRAKVAIERDIAAANKAIENDAAKLAVLEQQLKDWQRAGERRDALQQAIAGAVDNTELRASLVKAIQENAHAADYKPTLPGIVGDYHTKKAALTAAQVKSGSAESIVNDLELKIEQLAEVECCPTCGNRGETLKAALQAKYDSLLADANKALAEAKLAEDKADAAFEEIKERHQAAMEADALVETAKAAYNKASAELQALNDRESELTKAKAELTGLTVGTEPDKAAMDALTLAISGQRLKIKMLGTELTQCVAAMSEELRRNETKAKQEKIEAEAELFKLAVDAVAAKQTEVVEKSMASIVKIAGEVADGIIAGNLAWKDGEIGIQRGGQWISHEVFSGTEKAVAYVAFSLALSQSSPFKLVLMDELGVIDDANLARLITKLEAMLANGIIDQFIGVDVRAGRYESLTGAGVNVIKV